MAGKAKSENEVIKIREVGAALGIILPKVILTKTGWELNTKLLFKVKNGELTFFERSKRSLGFFNGGQTKGVPRAEMSEDSEEISDGDI